MALIVQKFGGSSVANAERILHVAEIITNTFKKGNQVVVVLSAQGDTTDELLEKAAELNPAGFPAGDGYAAQYRRADVHCADGHGH